MLNTLCLDLCKRSDNALFFAGACNEHHAANLCCEYAAKCLFNYFIVLFIVLVL